MVTTRPFGVTSQGEPVTEYILTNAAGMQVRCLDWGGHVTAVLVPDRAGRMVDVVLGFDTVAEYEQDETFLGAFVGRFANRIENAAFELDGVRYALTANNGPNHNHGVWHRKAAAGVQQGQEGRSVTFRYESPDGEDGFPGNVTAWLTYRLEEDNALTIEYRAVADRATPINLTNHSYFNLAGGGDVLDHRLTLHAARFTPANEHSCPYGSLEPVAGTPMDFTAEKPIGQDIDAAYDQLIWGRGYDHNWCVDGEAGTLRPAAEVRCEATGITLTCLTTQPGVQFYTGNWLERVPGKSGQPIFPRAGFCLETQHYPCGPNRPQFPDCILRPGAEYHQTTQYRFGAR